MTGFDGGATVAERMRAHAGDQDHLYGHLMRAMADDWETGGPVRDICRGWEDAPIGAVIQLRLLAGLFRIVLTDRAPELVPYYPCLGGTAPPDQAWPVVRRVLSAHVDELRDALEIAPQTNEVGRSTALLVGVFEAVRRSGLDQVRLLEPGASAGLNLLVDRFRFEEDSWSYGPADSPLVLRDCFEGDVEPVGFRVVSRRGCDLAPVDPTTDDGALRLRSFVWPFHVERHERLMPALELARRTRVPVDRSPAGDWLADQLASPPSEDVVTVVWQSITRQYWPAGEVAVAREVIEDASGRMPLAWVSMEYPSMTSPVPTVTMTGIGTRGGWSREEVVLGTVGDHGTPMRVGDRAER